MFAAAESVAVAGKPPVKPIGQGPDERDSVGPGEESSLRQQAKNLLYGVSALPRSASRADHLKRLCVRGRWDPREAIHDARRLRRDDLHLPVPIPLADQLRDARAHTAGSIVNDGVDHGSAVSLLRAAGMKQRSSHGLRPWLL